VDCDKSLHSLVSLESFKLLYGIDDREDELARFFLETATAQIEGKLVAGNFILQENVIVAPCEGICFWSVNLRCFAACIRRLVFKRITQGFGLTADNCFSLIDYPVRSVLRVEVDSEGRRDAARAAQIEREQRLTPRGANKKHDGNAMLPDARKGSTSLPIGSLPSGNKRKPFADGVGCIVSANDYYVTPEFSDLENYPYFLHIKSSCPQYNIRKIVKVVYCAGYKIFDVPPDLKKATLELAAWNYKRHKDNSFDGTMPPNVCELLIPWRRKTI
jgi:hypothetical protein